MFIEASWTSIFINICFYFHKIWKIKNMISTMVCLLFFCIFWRAKHFYFYEAQLTNYFFSDSCFLCPINKTTLILSYKDFHLLSSRGFVSLDFIWVLFISLSAYFWLHWVFTVAPRLCLVLASGGFSLAVIHGPLGAVASLTVAHGLQSLWAQPLWCLGFVAPQHVWFYFLDRGLNLCPLHWQTDS